MGQHIASTMAQIVSEELGASWKDMRVQARSNDPKFNDPVLRAQLTGGSWTHDDELRRDEPRGCCGRTALTEAAAASMGVPASELVVRDSVVSHSKSKKSMSSADIVKSGKIDQDLHAGRTARRSSSRRPISTPWSASRFRSSTSSKTNGTAKYGIDVMLPGMVYGKVVTPPVRSAPR